jgi:hypothetical protein
LGGEVTSRAGTNYCNLVVRQLSPNYLLANSFITTC